MVPKRVDSTYQQQRPAYARAECDVFYAHLPGHGMVKLNKDSIFVITETQFAIYGQARNVYCGCNNNAIFSDRVIFTFTTVAVCQPR